MDLSFYINNQLVNPPESWQNLEIELDFTNNSPDANIKTTTFTWLGSNAYTLNSWFKNGLIGGYGIFEGIPFRIEACDGITIFDGVIDMTSEDTTFQCDLVKASVKETNRIQFLNDRAESFTFAYLKSIGLITSNDYIPVPYVISIIPDWLQASTLVVTFIEMIKLIKDAIQSVIAFINSAVGAFPVIWLMAVYLVLAIAASIYAAFLTKLAINVLKMLFNELIQPIKFKYGMKVNTMFEKACDYLGLSFSSTIFGSGFNVTHVNGSFTGYGQYIGSFNSQFTATITNGVLNIVGVHSTFPANGVFSDNVVGFVNGQGYTIHVTGTTDGSSNFYGTGTTDPISNNSYKNLVIIPKKQAYFDNIKETDHILEDIFSPGFNRKSYDDVKNINSTIPSYGYYDGTFADLIRDMEDVFNAKVLIRNNTLYFERWDYWNNQANYTLPNISKEAPFDNPYGTNAFELSSNYFIKYQLDSTDDNTLDNYNGTSCEMTLVPNIVGIQKNVLLKGLTEKSLNFSLAKRKTELTTPEIIINKILEKLGQGSPSLWDMLNFWGGIATEVSDLASERLTNSINISNIAGSAIGFNEVSPPSWCHPALGMVLPLPDSPSQDRIGAMLLSCDFIGVPKLLVVEDNSTSYTILYPDTHHQNGYKIDQNNNIPSTGLGYTDAYNLAINYHAASWAVDKKSFYNYTIGNYQSPISYPNQYLTYKENEIPLCCSDFTLLKDNNIIKDIIGRFGRVESIKWNPFNETALIDYKINDVFTKNLSQTIIVDGSKVI
jgi:hypothetical protein